jgi:cell division protein FtsL
MGNDNQGPATQNAGAVIELYAHKLSACEKTNIVQTVIIAERDETITKQAKELDTLRQEVQRLTGAETGTN